MMTFLKKIFQKNTKTCEHCGCRINPKKDPALCVHGSELGIPFDTYICEPCCEKICYEYEAYEAEYEDIKIAEED